MQLIESRRSRKSKKTYFGEGDRISNENLKKKKNPSNKQKLEPDGFIGEFFQNFKEEWIPVLLKLFQKIEEEGILAHFYETSITLIPKINKDTKKKKKNYRTLSLMNKDANILNQTIANWIQYIKRILHHDQLGFIPGIQVCDSASTNQSVWYTTLTKWRIKIMIISIDVEKTLDKIQHPLWWKFSKK